MRKNGFSRWPCTHSYPWNPCHCHSPSSQPAALFKSREGRRGKEGAGRCLLLVGKTSFPIDLLTMTLPPLQSKYSPLLSVHLDQRFSTCFISWPAKALTFSGHPITFWPLIRSHHTAGQGLTSPSSPANIWSSLPNSYGTPVDQSQQWSTMVGNHWSRYCTFFVACWWFHSKKSKRPCPCTFSLPCSSAVLQDLIKLCPEDFCSLCFLLMGLRRTKTEPK